MEDDRARGGIPDEQLEARISALEAAVERFGREVRTRRLAVLDEEGGERLVAEVSDRVALFHLSFSSGEDDGLLVFAAPSGDAFPPGCGVQAWWRGDVARFLEWWEGD